MVKHVVVKRVGKRDHWEEPGEDGRIVKWIKEMGCESLGWIHLAQDSGKWYTLVQQY